MQQQTEQKSSAEKIPTRSGLSPKIELYSHPDFLVAQEQKLGARAQPSF